MDIQQYTVYFAIAGGLLFVLITGVIMGKLHREDDRGPRFDHEYYAKALVRAAQSLRVRDVGPRLAVIDAAKLLDQALAEAGVDGFTSADRIRAYKGNLADANKAWAVNKEYERLIQEPESTIDIKRARNAVKAVEAELVKLGAL